MPESVITAEEFATWLPASVALSLVAKSQGEWASAATALLERLAAGLIPARAETIIWEIDGKSIDKGPRALVPEPVLKEWANNKPAAAYSFWKSNDAITKHQRLVPGSYPRTDTYKLFGIRFEAAAIHKMLPAVVNPRPASSAPTPAPAPPPAPLVVASKDQGPKGPPVSKAALVAWYAAYQLAFQDTEDTEAIALESAQGCFPGKSVSRDAIRALRGARKRGPKPTSAE